MLSTLNSSKKTKYFKLSSPTKILGTVYSVPYCTPNLKNLPDDIPNFGL